MASEARSVGVATRRVPLQLRDGNVAAASPSSVDVMGEAARALLRPWRSPSTSTAGPSSQPPPPVHHHRFHPGRFPSSSPPRFDRNYTSWQLVYGVWFGSAKALAKELVQSRKAVNRLYENKAQLNSISMHLGEIIGPGWNMKQHVCA